MCADEKIDTVIGVESRGFIFATPLAYQLGAGFVPVRKPKKLPAEKVSVSYDLEYGQDTLEMHKDAVGEGHRVLIVDDLLATGGTAQGGGRSGRKRRRQGRRACFSSSNSISSTAATNSTATTSVADQLRFLIIGSMIDES